MCVVCLCVHVCVCVCVCINVVEIPMSLASSTTWKSKEKMISQPRILFPATLSQVVGTVKILPNVQTPKMLGSPGGYGMVCSHWKEGVNQERWGWKVAVAWEEEKVISTLSDSEGCSRRILCVQDFWKQPLQKEVRRWTVLEIMWKKENKLLIWRNMIGWYE